MTSLKYIGAVLVLTFLTTVNAKDSIKYTDSSQIFLILNRAIKDVDNGKANLLGGKSAYEAFKLSGFRVKALDIVSMGEIIDIELQFVGPNREPLKDWQNNVIPSNFHIQSKYENWKNMLQ
jgi:hypothetical protein